MDRRQNFHGQLVTADEFVELFDLIEEMEWYLRTDSGLAQQAQADAPGPEVFGGIQGGLTLSGIGSDTLTVAAGRAVDNAGRRINLPAGATVKVTNTGVTTIGETADVAGSGALISSSCPLNRRIVLSLYIVYDEKLSDQRQDADGTFLWYDLDQSFKFDLEIGGDFANPPIAPITRDALADGVVLLADVVLENLAGNMVIREICYVDQDWDDVGAFYQDLNGRTSNHIHFDQTGYFPQYNTKNMELQASTNRGALFQLLAQLQAQAADPAGASIIGARTQTGVAFTENAAGPQVIAAGSVDSQIKELLDVFSNVLHRGGNNIVKPPAGHWGTIYNSDDMDVDQSLIGIRTELNGLGWAALMGKKRGHIAVPNMIVDPFYYRNDPATGKWDGGDKWGNRVYNTIAGPGTGDLRIRHIGLGAPYKGGIVDIRTGGAAGDVSCLTLGYDSSPQWASVFDLTQNPWAKFAVRFQIPTTIVDSYFHIGFVDWTAAQPTFFCGLIFANPVAGPDTNVYAIVQGVGPVTDADPIIPVLAPDRWYTVRCAVIDDGTAAFQVDNGPAELIQDISATSNFPSDMVFEAAIADASNAATLKSLYLDQAAVGEGHLQTDML